MSWFQEEYEKKVAELRKEIGTAAVSGSGVELGEVLLKILDLFAEHTHSVMERTEMGKQLLHETERPGV